MAVTLIEESNRLFHIHTKLAIMALMPTLFSFISAIFFRFFLYLKMLVNGMAKTKLAILSFLRCGEIVKNSIV